MIDPRRSLTVSALCALAALCLLWGMPNLQTVPSIQGGLRK